MKFIKLKKAVAVVLIGTMSSCMMSSAFATEMQSNVVNNSEIKQAIVTEDNSSRRVAEYDGIKVIYDKINNMMYVYDGNTSYSYSLENQITEDNLKNIVESESVALHRYQHNTDDYGSYYWSIDIPSYNINPNNWCGWISVWEDGSLAATFAEEFKGYIDAAQDDEHTLAIFGGATLVAGAAGLVTKNPVWSESLFKTVCAACGVVVSVGVLDAGASYFNNLDNAREKYFSVRQILG